MMRELLKDRFHLQFHTEIHQEKILTMSVDSDGIRLKEVAGPVPPEPEGHFGVNPRDDGGHMYGNKVTMAKIAQGVGGILREVVADETNLKGYYDFDVRWTAPPLPGAPPPKMTLGADGIALWMTTMKDQLGLRFTGSTGPVPYWVIDHIEQPSEN
jgi:uncharacterized protein (TIGR03435 family)